MKGGRAYNGLYAYKNTNTNIYIHSVGNGDTIYDYANDLNQKKREEEMNTNPQLKESNILLVEPPGVGNSEYTDANTLGEAQELAITFAEKRILEKQKDKKDKQTNTLPRLFVHGYSLGGAAVGQAVLQHEQFHTQNIHYQFVFDHTFDTMLTITDKLVGNKLCGGAITTLAGFAIDTRQAVNKLLKLGIPTLIINSNDDEVISFDTSLLNALSDMYNKDNNCEYRLNSLYEVAPNLYLCQVNGRHGANGALSRNETYCFINQTTTQQKELQDQLLQDLNTQRLYKEVKNKYENLRKGNKIRINCGNGDGYWVERNEATKEQIWLWNQELDTEIRKLDTKIGELDTEISKLQEKFPKKEEFPKKLNIRRKQENEEYEQVGQIQININRPWISEYQKDPCSGQEE